MTCFLRFDDCKISYFEINFDIKRQVVTNKAKAGPGFALFSSSRVANILALRLCFAKWHHETQWKHSRGKANTNSRIIITAPAPCRSRAAFFILGGVRPGRLVYCQVQCVTKDHVTWNVWGVTSRDTRAPSDARVARVSSPGRGKISKLQYCVARLSSEASCRGYWGHGWSVSPQNKPRLRDGPSLKYSMLGRSRA